jgi:hypothetical protein
MDVASEREREREKKEEEEEEEEAGMQHRVDWGPVCSMQLTRRRYTTCICSTPTLHA